MTRHPAGGHWTFPNKTTPEYFPTTYYDVTKVRMMDCHNVVLEIVFLCIKKLLTILFYTLVMHWCDWSTLDIQKTSNLLTVQQKLTRGEMLDETCQGNTSNKVSKDISISDFYIRYVSSFILKRYFTCIKEDLKEKLSDSVHEVWLMDDVMWRTQLLTNEKPGDQ